MISKAVKGGARSRRLAASGALALALSLAACGGNGGSGDGGSSDNGGGNGGGGGSTPPPPVSLQARIDAATATAQNGSNACGAIQPFFWEVGDQNERKASGSVPSNNGNPTYTGSSAMSIASASKWLYGAYVVQLRQSQSSPLTADDIKYLTFRSGYTSFSKCLKDQTVQQCVDYLDNGKYTAANDGFFSYGGGHMEKHASLIGLGALDNAGLTAEVRSKLGITDTPFTYGQPQLAGGVVTSADVYAVFLRKILAGTLAMKEALGTNAVCTNPKTCPSEARNAPIPESESYSYSIGHWVESDPLNGDGAFSSAGAFGFYPWIDKDKTWYGIVARQDASRITDPDNPDSAGHGFDSAQCGQLIRHAWIDGVAR